MIYILDTNIIRKLLFHFPKKGKIFEDIWAKLEAGKESIYRLTNALMNFPVSSPKIMKPSNG